MRLKLTGAGLPPDAGLYIASDKMTTGGSTTGLLPGAWSDLGQDLLRLLFRGKRDP